MEELVLTVTGRELEPWVKKGGRVRIQRCVSLRDGQVGLFLWREQPLLRQYCEDSEGNIYLFAPNRRIRGDVRVPRGERVYCFGRVLMPEVPLPQNMGDHF
ncbi:MAG: S24 family peptidase [bacterium]